MRCSLAHGEVEGGSGRGSSSCGTSRGSRSSSCQRCCGSGGRNRCRDFQELLVLGLEHFKLDCIEEKERREGRGGERETRHSVESYSGSGKFLPGSTSSSEDESESEEEEGGGEAGRFRAAFLVSRATSSSSLD